MSVNKKPPISDEAAMNAFALILEWLGDNPEREGLRDTPKRVAQSFREYFSGYAQNPHAILRPTFNDAGDHQDSIIVLNNIKVESYCEHHLAPIIGKACIAYIPNGPVIGISKMARLVEAYAKRLQIQERLTNQIAQAIQDVLNPKGVGVAILAEHYCLAKRGVKNDGCLLYTRKMLGMIDNTSTNREEFLQAAAELYRFIK